MEDVKETVRSIVKKALEAGGYEGLHRSQFISDGACSCTLEDLMHCGYPAARCTPGCISQQGYKLKCKCGVHHCEEPTIVTPGKRPSP